MPQSLAEHKAKSDDDLDSGLDTDETLKEAHDRHVEVAKAKLAPEDSTS